jgi:CubicO group peptidase (beta-lactamase class C family)
MIADILRICLIFSLLTVGSCQSIKKKKIIRKAKEVTEEISFLPKFPEPSKSYVRAHQKDIDKFFKEVMGGRYFNGQFLVAKNGQVIYFKAQGYANFRKRWKISPKTPLHVASVSKVATALAILRLVDQKKILLDGDVRRYLPDLPYEGITVRMLLNHRSGIQYYGYFTYYTWHLGKTLYNKDILDLLKEHKFRLNFPPGKKFSYCNTNYALLALIVEKVTRKPFPIENEKHLYFETNDRFSKDLPVV